MDINWTYWELSKYPGSKSVTGVCRVAEHELQCEMVDYLDGATVKKDMEKIVEWALNNEENVKRHILEHYYFHVIWICQLYNTEHEAENANKLQALVQNGQDIGVKPFASRENMQRYLKLNSIWRDYGFEGFSLEFTSAEDELDVNMGGHGPIIGIGDDFSFGEFDWSG